MKKQSYNFYLCVFIISLNFSSLKSQVIKAYFNQSVDNTISTITDAKTSSHLEDTICDIINKSNLTIDLAVWDNGSAKIVTALNNAFARGVLVRYISSGNSLNTALSGLNSSIPLLKRSSILTSNVMHNKFIISDNKLVLTGSMNFGLGSMEDDYNNILIVSNVSLALNYKTEFDEMWGSTGAVPNTTLSKFGPAKSDNTIHFFTVGTIPVESYFSPSDLTSAKIVNAINSANFSLDIAMFTFTDNDLGDAVKAAKLRGVNVRCIIENVSYFGSEYSGLLSSGINTLSHASFPNDFHHKYCIIDAMNPSSDPLVVTGSHNWSNSANDEYDENTLIIHDLNIAHQYTEEFTKRFVEMGGVSGIQNLSDVLDIAIYPNPTNGLITLNSSSQKLGSLKIYNALGQQVLFFPNIKFNETMQLNLEHGLYCIELEVENTIIKSKLIIK